MEKSENQSKKAGILWKIHIKIIGILRYNLCRGDNMPRLTKKLINI